MTSLLWVTAPYVALTSFVLGHIWRYRTDQFGWTTRSSQIYESRLLRLGSPLFHFGLLGVFGGHVVGLLIPQSWTSAVGISEPVYHLMAVTMGSLAGFAVVAGLGILLYRRITVPAVRKATTRNDKLMYVLLVGALVTGMLNTLTNVFARYNYRETVSPWFRSLFSLHSGGRADGPCAVDVSGACADCPRAAWYLALHTAGAYVQRAGRVPGAPGPGLPQPRPAESIRQPLCKSLGRTRSAACA